MFEEYLGAYFADVTNAFEEFVGDALIFTLNLFATSGNMYMFLKN